MLPITIPRKALPRHIPKALLGTPQSRRVKPIPRRIKRRSRAASAQNARRWLPCSVSAKARRARKESEPSEAKRSVSSSRKSVRKRRRAPTTTPVITTRETMCPARLA